MFKLGLQKAEKPEIKLPTIGFLDWIPSDHRKSKEIPKKIYFCFIQLGSVQSFSCVRHFVTYGLQHARLPCPSPTPGACSNSCPLSRWCHPTISSSASLTTLKLLTEWITTNCGKFFKRREYQTAFPTSWETCMQVKKQQLELDMEKWIGSTVGKAVYCHPAYLTSI